VVDQNLAQYSLDMSLATAELPTDPTELYAFALACQGELKVAEVSVQYKTLEIGSCSTRLNDSFPVQDGANCLIRIESAACRRTNNGSNGSEQIGTPV
jgi:hypothetical protein